MTRQSAPQQRISRLQHQPALPGVHLNQSHDGVPPPQPEPQIVDRRGVISALIESTPNGYEVFWRLVRGSATRVLDRRGPYRTRALAICWARVGLMLREESWLSIHSGRQN